jgi:hypothetical protein
MKKSELKELIREEARKILRERDFKYTTNDLENKITAGGALYITNEGLLDVDVNKLSKLPPLPRGLTDLYCMDNKLTELPPLPKSLKTIYCEGNNLPYSKLDPETIRREQKEGI